MSNISRRKGARVENEVAHTLQRYGIPATKRSGMYIPGHDIDARVGGRDLRVEVKSRAQGFGALYKFLEQRDVLDRQGRSETAAMRSPTRLGGPACHYSRIDSHTMKGAVHPRN